MFWKTFHCLCNNNNTTPSKVVAALKIAAGSITKWKNGATPSGKTLQKIADYFGVTVDYLLSGPSLPSSDNYHSSLSGYKVIPVLSSYETDEENPVKYLVGEEAVCLPEGEYFGIKISDDSMAPSLLPGDTVIIKKQDTAECGDLVLCKLDAAPAVMRQIKKESLGICLIPRNSREEIIFISNTEADRLTICGIATELRRTIKI